MKKSSTIKNGTPNIKLNYNDYIIGRYKQLYLKSLRALLVDIKK